MLVRCIFESNSSEVEGLWSIIDPETNISTLDEILDKWNDPEYMIEYCTQNLADLRLELKDQLLEPEEIADELINEAERLEDLLRWYASGDDYRSLQQVFRPLNNKEDALVELQLSKARLKNHPYPPVLRIYAVRIAENAYVATGGAIKLTHYMDERMETEEQLKKLKQVRSRLKDQGICFPEDLNAE